MKLMASELRSGSSSPPSSSSSSAGAATAMDRMVKIEMEAAEVLAGLAHFTARAGGGDFGGKWGCKARSMKNKKKKDQRVKVESPPPTPSPLTSRSNPSNLALRCIDADPPPPPAAQETDPLHQDLAAAFGTITAEPMKIEEDNSLNGGSNVCSTSYLSLAVGQSRHNLSEAEKEAKRLRRVLANRESARRTIRRRQALCEELTRRAAELTHENEELKKGKESALREYQSLETTNKKLKAEMAKAMKPEVAVALTEAKAMLQETSVSPTDCPMLWYSGQFAPIIWPPVFQSPGLSQSQCLADALAISSNTVMPAFCKLNPSHEQENLIHACVPRPPMYVLPCPWFFSIADPGNIQHGETSCSVKSRQDEASAVNQPSWSSSSRTDMQKEDDNSLLPITMTSEAPGLAQWKIKNDLNEVPVESPSDGGDGHEDDTSTPTRLSCFDPGSAINYENGASKDLTFTSFEAVSLGASDRSCVKQEKQKQLDAYARKKLTDAIAAAEARKRRKEITKLKSIHSHQCRLRC